MPIYQTGTHQATLPFWASLSSQNARVSHARQTGAALEDIQSKCKECPYLAPQPYIVKFAVPYEDVMLNGEVIVDIMYIEDLYANVVSHISLCSR